MTLQRLAAFFQDQHQQARGRRKPVILIGPRAGDDGRCLVIGYEATQRMRVSRRKEGRARGCMAGGEPTGTCRGSRASPPAVGTPRSSGPPTHSHVSFVAQARHPAQ